MAIRAANGGILTARAIVDAATSPGHELHGRFEWDDAKAADRHRLDQARALVRVVRERQLDRRGHPVSLRVFHSLPEPASPTGRAYVTLDEIKASEPLTRELRRQMDFDWRALKRRYDQYEDFWRLVERETREHADEAGEGDEPEDLGDGD